jgi:hypothetical protein
MSANKQMIRQLLIYVCNIYALHTIEWGRMSYIRMDTFQKFPSNV